jgi:hypothetical protein
MTPVISLWNEKHGEFESDLVNLTYEPALKIVRAARSPLRIAA